ncbi:hypothetical protein EJ03DRAFT_355759 [Teratosphaeria nubilosa]|uniref:Uncharacterized protein n=1 Tax=Teratosphaeria nubilosa TaxID=161662 RepID=A0A6G1KUV0_9PEZI|nr:hypothetical protein EJ03DRAFT_355759 [Teratosphaeria nubilosa]
MVLHVQLTIAARREAIIRTSTMLSTAVQDDTFRYKVTKLTIGFTNGLETGFSASEFAELIVEGRSAAAVAEHDEILEALACGFLAGRWSCKGVKKLVIKGMSCTYGLNDFLEALEFLDSMTLESLTFREEDALALFDNNPFAELPGLENLTIRDVSLLEQGQTHATADAKRVPLLEPLRLHLPRRYTTLDRSFSGEDGGEPGSLKLYPEENVVVMTCYNAMRVARGTLWPGQTGQ